MTTRTRGVVARCRRDRRLDTTVGYLPARGTVRTRCHRLRRTRARHRPRRRAMAYLGMCMHLGACPNCAHAHRPSLELTDARRLPHVCRTRFERREAMAWTVDRASGNAAISGRTWFDGGFRLRFRKELRAMRRRGVGICMTPRGRRHLHATTCQLHETT